MGLFRVKVYSEHGMAQRNGTGMFPREVVQKPLPPLVGRLLPSKGATGPFGMKRFPLLPLEEEGRLSDMPLRENFIERVLAAQFFRAQTAHSHGRRC